jgi:hypothetical protein
MKKRLTKQDIIDLGWTHIPECDSGDESTYDMRDWPDIKTLVFHSYVGNVTICEWNYEDGLVDSLERLFHGVPGGKAELEVIMKQVGV